MLEVDAVEGRSEASIAAVFVVTSKPHARDEMEGTAREGSN